MSLTKLEVVKPCNMNYFFLLLSYLIGALSSSVWIGLRFFNTDVREHGSGNAGATNTFRVLGKPVGILVLILDVLKGWVAVTLLSYLAGNETVEFKLTLGLIAVIGHIFPIYIGFRGGKGIASLLGVIIAIHPYAALISCSVFLVSLLLWKFVSLSSILAAIAFPLAILIYFNEKNAALNIFSIMVTVLVLFTHKKNIERLFNKEESKVKILKKSIRKK